LIARLKEQKASIGWFDPGGVKDEIDQRILFLEEGLYGAGIRDKDKMNKLDWNILQESGSISAAETKKQFRKTGGSITKDRWYHVHKDEIIRAPFSGTVERVGRAKQLIAQGGGRITYIDLPAEVVEGKTPKIKTPSAVATRVDSISPVNAMNPYMIETPSILGIRV